MTNYDILNQQFRNKTNYCKTDELFDEIVDVDDIIDENFDKIIEDTQKC